MKHFHLYGLGNALVDIDFEVSYETIKRLNIDKGVMTLVDDKRHLQLLENLSGIKHIKACGGSAANTTMIANQLGCNSFYSCKIANDLSGDFFYDELIRHGITTNLTPNNHPDGTTGTCLVLVTPDADRTMNTHLGITETLSTAELNEEAIAESEYLYIEGYLSPSSSATNAAITAFEIAKKYQTKTSLSLADPNMVNYFKSQLDAIINDGIDLLFCNEDEAKLFSQTSSLKIACDIFKDIAKTFVITRGAKGAIIYSNQQLYEIPSKKILAIDTVGAGDMFAGGFIYSLTKGYHPKIAGIIGNIVASKIVTKFGPRLNEHEVLEIKEEINNALTENVSTF